MYQALFAKQIRLIVRQQGAIMEFIPPWNPPLLMRRNRPTPDLWALRRTAGRTQFWKNYFQCPVSKMISIEKGVSENTHIFCLGRTESTPVAFEMKKPGWPESNLGVSACDARGLTGAPPSHRLPGGSWPKTPLPPVYPDLIPPPH